MAPGVELAGKPELLRPDLDLHHADAPQGPLLGLAAERIGENAKVFSPLMSVRDNPALAPERGRAPDRGGPRYTRSRSLGSRASRM
ncbi:MAG: hypothetical protein A2X50_15455 [Candidatus Rokubacteria bacterium GWF2_70_14]|nr:MAG: hypothetical protein A2X50_15455 [Candidatus Rokubacteria bacterium GWF2_70_14]